MIHLNTEEKMIGYIVTEKFENQREKCVDILLVEGVPTPTTNLLQTESKWHQQYLVTPAVNGVIIFAFGFMGRLEWTANAS